ncbi:hypothetical protein [Nocardioides litoris]|uniref:hypothetical protein n=1 Tax=Nocardioides litoris TaxID=1926648 RepID=UPI001123004D|nr:hypothetical protein [Nocardioides litoris]
MATSTAAEDLTRSWAEQTDVLKRWGRTTDLPTPLDWGALEQQVMLQPRPSAEEMALMTPRRSRWTFLLGVPFLPLVVLPLSLVLGPVVVAVVVVLDATGTWWSAWSSELLGFFSVCGLIAAPAALWAAWDERRRDAVSLVLVVVNGIASGVTLVALGSGPSVGYDAIRTLALVTAVAHGVALLAMLVFLRSGARARLGERFEPGSPEEEWILHLRLALLASLVKRDLVAAADVPGIAWLPVSSWHELETRPDGRTVRR